MLPKEKQHSINLKYVLTSLFALGVITSLGVVTYLQGRDLAAVNQRLRDIEDAFHESRRKRSLPEDDENLTNLVKKYCELAKEPCARGNTEERDTTLARPARASPCCLKLAAPSYRGLATETVHAVIGQTVLLPCRTSGYPPPSVHWNVPSSSKHFHQSPTGLTVKGVVAKDDRAYTCTISNIFGKKVKVVKLSVTEPISVHLSASATNHTEGILGSITLNCSYRGIPDPAVKWLHIGPLGKTHSINSGIKTSVTAEPISKHYVSILTLTFPNIFASGTYICQVKNALEQKHDNVSITIFAKPRVVTPPLTQTVTKGKNVTLKCQVVGFPSPVIKWEFPQSQGHPPFNARVNPDQTVTLFSVDEFNQGEYRCIASNRYGSAQGTGTITVIKPVRIQVTSQVNSLKGAPAIALDCHASGDPTPTVSWSKLEGTINRNDPRYIILPNGDFILTTITSGTMEKDSGVYKCTATNGVTTTSKLSVVYMDLGHLNCSTTFQDCSTKTGVACGGRCPLGCASQPAVLFGYETYSGNSFVCQAAIQYGSITDNGGLALWYMRDGIRLTFNGSTSHGHHQQPDWTDSRSSYRG